GDTLVVWRLDRLGRSLPHLVSIVQNLKERGISFKSIQDGAIDTTTASGELIFHIFSALAQFERSLISERTKAGLKAARARGKNGGRPRIDPDDNRIKTARALSKDKNMAVPEICKTLKISRATYYRWINVDGADQ
ncbi:MAG: recombinase family protein, partial [bacterium]|nr:recombinase family protein [bacterium]